jgi:nucleoside-diphosphate-sugar epimerase
VKVLITGGAGMVGSHIADELIRDGHSVTAIDNLSTGRSSHLAPHPNLNFIQGTINDSAQLAGLLDRFGPFDVVVHTAAEYADNSKWELQTETNVLGTINVIRIAQLCKARFIYFQTALCYGISPTVSPVPLDYPRQPMSSSYAISKTAGEFYVEASGLDFVIFRLANIVGPRNLSGAIPIFYKRISEGIECTISDAKRDFVDVRNLAYVAKQAILGSGSGAYHFSSGKDSSIEEVFQLIAQKLNKQDVAKYNLVKDSGGPASILLDPSRTYADFEMPRISTLQEIIDAAINYYEAFGVDRELTQMKNSK